MSIKLKEASTFLVFIISMFAAYSYSVAQNRNWKENTSKDGKVFVKSEVATEKGPDGEEGKVIYYIAESKYDISLQKVEAFMRNAANYKLFLENTEESKKIKSISSDEWITYLYFDAPWPLPNSDCVQKMTYSKNGENSFSIQAKVEDGHLEKKDVGRMDLYDALYEFTKTDDGKVKLKLTAAFAPLGSAPSWMLNSWFPEGPAGIITRLFENASK